ncbi:MAG: C25 family cysteine peptidase, partial [Bacteroidota bacterium]
MKHLFHIIIIIIIALCSKAMSQQYSNHWINYGSQYYKMQVVEEGIYRIDISMLVSAGVPVTSLDPRNFQIFCRGREQYIYVKGENDGIFNPSDFIEFYATKNDGTLDTGMYNFPSSQLNPYYSLINDTNAYFLTWNNSTSNRRLSLETDVDFSSYSPETWCVKPVLQLFTSQFSYGETTNGPWYNQSEGWFDYRFGKQSAGAPTSVTKTILTPNPFTGGPSTRISIALSGSSNAASSSSYNHHLGIDFLGISYDTLYNGYKNISIEKNVNSLLLSSSFSMIFKIIDDQNATTDLQQLSYILVEYPHSFDFEGSDSFKFYIPDGPSGKSFLTIYNFDGGNSPVLYDLTNMKRMTVIESSGVYRTLVPNSGGDKTCYFVSENNIHQVNNLHSVSYTDYSVYGFNSDYIIISHPKLWSSAQAYSSYRAATGFTPLLADINQLYDQFAYGINKHPEAIRRFIEYLAYTYDSVPKYLFIIGKSIHANTTRNYPNYYALSLVPSYGFLSSDMLLTSGLGNTQFEPLVPT